MLKSKINTSIQTQTPMSTNENDKPNFYINIEHQKYKNRKQNNYQLQKDRIKNANRQTNWQKLQIKIYNDNKKQIHKQLNSTNSTLENFDDNKS